MNLAPGILTHALKSHKGASHRLIILRIPSCCFHIVLFHSEVLQHWLLPAVPNVQLGHQEAKCLCWEESRPVSETWWICLITEFQYHPSCLQEHQFILQGIKVILKQKQRKK